MCAVQETGLTHLAFGAAAFQAKDAGWKALFHGPFPLAKKRATPVGGKEYRDSALSAAGGVAILTKGRPAARFDVPTHPSRDRFWDVLLGSKRWNAVGVTLPNNSALFVHNVYLPTRARQNQECRSQAEEILRAAFLAASTHGGAPALVCGDTNMAPQDSEVIQAALASGLWHDVIDAFAHLPSTKERVHAPSPTHFPTNLTWATKEEGCRIDRIIVNTPALRIISDAWTIPKRVSGGHLPLCVRFDLDAAAEKGLVLEMPQGVPLPVHSQETLP